MQIAKVLITCILFIWNQYLIWGQGVIRTENKSYLLKAIKNDAVNVIFFKPDNCQACFKNDEALDRYCRTRAIQRVFILDNVNTKDFLRHINPYYENLLKGHILIDDTTLKIKSFGVGNVYFFVKNDTIQYQGSCANFTLRDTQFFGQLRKENIPFSSIYVETKEQGIQLDKLLRKDNYNNFKFKFELKDSGIAQSLFNTFELSPRKKRVFVYKIYRNSFLRIYSIKRKKLMFSTKPSFWISPDIVNLVYKSIYLKNTDNLDTALAIRSRLLVKGFEEIEIENIYIEKDFYFVFCSYRPIELANDSQFYYHKRLLILKVNKKNQLRDYWFETKSQFSDLNRYPSTLFFRSWLIKNIYYVKNNSENTTSVPMYLKINLSPKNHFFILDSSHMPKIKDSQLFNYSPKIVTNCFAFAIKNGLLFNIDAVPIIYIYTKNKIRLINVAKDYYKKEIDFDTITPILIVDVFLKNNNLKILIERESKFFIFTYSLKKQVLIKIKSLPNVKSYFPQKIDNKFILYQTITSEDEFGIKVARLKY